METTIYQDGNYTVTGSADGRTYRVTISNGTKSQGINFFPLDAAGKTEISRNLPYLRRHPDPYGGGCRH